MALTFNAGSPDLKPGVILLWKLQHWLRLPKAIVSGWSLLQQPEKKDIKKTQKAARIYRNKNFDCKYMFLELFFVCIKIKPPFFRQISCNIQGRKHSCGLMGHNFNFIRFSVDTHRKLQVSTHDRENVSL